MNDLVAVQGLSWCKEEPKIIGVNNLTKNILCTYHNSTLSPVDDAAIAAFDVFRESVNITSARETLKERYWNTLHLKIDGNGLERWFLKTLINVAVGGKEKIGPKSDAAGDPSCDLVEIAYGQRKFNPNAGLYYSAEKGEKIDSQDKVTIIPFFDQNNEFMLGATFYFRGFRFMLTLDEIGFTGNLTFVHKDGLHTSQYSKPLRHLRQIRVTVGPSQKYLSHTIDFEWN